MEIKLKKIILQNFKGVKYLEVVFSESTAIRGKNATGKTSIFDAFNWALFGKDSKGRTDFAVQTLDEKNQVIHNLEHSVELQLEFDGKPMKIKRLLVENWSKMRGQMELKLKGTETSFYVNDEPFKSNEFKKFIDGIIDESKLKLCTNLNEFLSLHWQKRRDIIVGIVGDVEDSVIMNNKLKEALGDSSVESFKKIINEKKKRLKEDLENFTPKIDENFKMIIDKDFSSLKEELKIKEEQLLILKNKCVQESNSSKIEELNLKNGSLENEIQSLKSKISNKKNEEVFKIKEELQNKKELLYKKDREFKDNENSISKFSAEIESKNQITETLRNEAREIKSSIYKNEAEFIICPHCNEKIQIGESETLEDFNLKKSKKLSEIVEKGKSLISEIEELNKEKTDLEIKNKNINFQVLDFKYKIEILEKNISNFKEEDINTNADFIKITAIIDKNKKEIDSLKNYDSNNSLKFEIDELDKIIEPLKKELEQETINNAALARIEELKKQQKHSIEVLEKIMEQESLLEEFTRTKMNALVDKINSKFKYVEFKLFDTQVNGAIVECCDILVEGVPYGSGLNTGASINASLEILSVLSKVYELNAPIFVDNCEAVTSLLAVDNQLIKLIVDEKQPVLKIN